MGILLNINKSMISHARDLVSILPALIAMVCQTLKENYDNLFYEIQVLTILVHGGILPVDRIWCH